MRLLVWLGIILSARGVRGETLAKDEFCVTAIFSAYNYISFQGDPAKGMWDTRCRNPLKVASIYVSSEKHCRDRERLTGLAQLAKLCQEVGHHELLSRDAVAENLTREAVDNMKVVDYLELSRADYQQSPVLLSASYYKRMFDTLDSWQFETWSHHAFSYVGYAYWAVILSLGILYRLWNWIALTRQHPIEYSLESSMYPPARSWRQLSFVDNAVHWVSTHLIIPAPLVGRGPRLLSCTFTSRAEAIVVAGFWLLSIILSVVGYRAFPGNIYWPDVTSQILRYSADRTGIMSFANFPLLLLLAGRNNILIWATGWSFATLNVFHRHVARIATLQAVAHSALYFVICVRINKVWKEMTKIYVLWGVLAFVVMILVLITSLDRIRAASYEMFMVAHIVFSVATLVGCFYHTIVFEGHEYWKYLWPSVIVWGIDRFLRLIRIVYCNVHVRLSKGKLITVTEGRMTYDEAADVIRLEVNPGHSGLEVRPGDYYFLYQPFRFTGWENHPFTVGASSYEVDPSGAQLDISGKTRNSFENSQLPLLSETPNGQETLKTGKGSYQGSLIPKLIFWIRPYDGWTQQLRQQCLRTPNQPVHATILLEGPYGQGFPLWRYETVLMIVGGTGIAAAVPYLQDHLRRCANNGWSGPSEEKPRTKEIGLVWTTRQSAFVRDLANRELKPMLDREDFRASFFVTGSSERFGQDWSGTGYTVQIGRPNLQSLILSRASDASVAGMKLAILVCGPTGMADEARAATHLAMRRGYQSIQYVEESFTW